MDKIKPSDLQAEAQQLLAAGKMPKLDDLLSVVAEAREKCADKIRAIRNDAGADALKS
jgi:hypothetical protein